MRDHGGHPPTSASRCSAGRRSSSSLYTFKYVDDVDSVLVFLPPTPRAKSNGSVFLRRDDVADELRRPLISTSCPHPPPSGALDAIERDNIDG